MAEFHDRMMAFTDRLKSSIEGRGEALAGVHQATVDLLGEARTFLDGVAHEHEARAEELHEFLSKTRSDRDETVSAMRASHREFLDDVAAEHGARTEDVNTFLSTSRDDRLEMVGSMMDRHRESLGAMRDEMRSTLDEANKARVEAVVQMTGAFRTARTELSSDLRGAAKAWREFASSDHGRGNSMSHSEESTAAGTSRSKRPAKGPASSSTTSPPSKGRSPRKSTNS